MANENIQWIRKVSNWLDTRFTIPGTKIKFGLDPVLSIFPAIGDLTTYLVSLFIIYTVKRKGASGELLLRMLINSTVDVVFGSIPVIGTIFDVFYRSNERNLALLEQHYEENKYQGSGKFLLALVIMVVLIVIAALIWLTFYILKEGIQFIDNLV